MARHFGVRRAHKMTEISNGFAANLHTRTFVSNHIRKGGEQSHRNTHTHTHTHTHTWLAFA